MDSLVTTALVGLARQEKVDLNTGTPVDALLARLPDNEIERKFLLCAGARALYCQAGKQAQQAPDLPAPADPERLRPCSPSAALVLSRLLAGEHALLLPGALARLRQYGLRLPPHLLPQALTITNKEIRAALAPVLGERGRWLGRFNPSWSWVLDFLPESENGLPPDAETIWQEGSTAQRTEILRRLRAVEPEKARAWLQKTWKQEKAEIRNAFLETLEIGLSPNDEPFLEMALDDRALSVRSRAASLLARLPDSALLQRMRQRAQQMIVRQEGKVVVEPPQQLEKDWLRDGIEEKPAQKISARSWWMLQVLSFLEPAFWEDHLGAQPADLFTLLADDPWEIQVMEGWSKAALSYHAANWIIPLWNWWHAHYQQAATEKVLTSYTYREQLLRQMPASVAERTLLKMLHAYDGQPNNDCWELLAEVPRPWNLEFARTYLQLLRGHCPVTKITAESFNPYADPWINDLPSLGLALPISCADEVAHLWELPDDQRWGIRYIRNQLNECIATIRMRKQIEEEII
jgi:hypothetical protein